MDCQSKWFWALPAARYQTATSQTVMAQLGTRDLITLPGLIIPEPSRLDLHDLRQLRQPSRSSAWQHAASRPAAILSQHTHKHWSWRLGWYVGATWVWAELELARQPQDTLTELAGGRYRLQPDQAGRQLTLRLPAIAASALTPAQPLQTFSTAMGLAGLVDQARTLSDAIVDRVRHAEQLHIRSRRPPTR